MDQDEVKVIAEIAISCFSTGNDPHKELEYCDDAYVKKARPIVDRYSNVIKVVTENLVQIVASEVMAMVTTGVAAWDL